jgi:alginate O-acetyltransferase complex protein AlgI
VTSFEIMLFLWLTATSLLAWSIPSKWQIDGIAISTFLFLALYSSWSCLWLLCGSLLVYSYQFIATPKNKALLAAMIASLLFSVFLFYKGFASSRTTTGSFPVMAGIAYYTCRNIHVLIEQYKVTLQHFPLRQYLQYIFFLPVITAGPIHRYPNFQRQCERRRWNSANLTGGLERILYGYAKIVVIGNYLLNLKAAFLFHPQTGSGFIDLLLLSVKDWLSLYIQFSGYTDVALGFALVLGFTIEENFNSPLKAKNLIDFWQRWHITLSAWCKDYIFAPVQALTRNQMLAVFCAMITMGLWHEVSIYYFLWGIYHAAGIALCRWYQVNNDPLRLARLPGPLHTILARTATFSWLVTGKPIIAAIMAWTMTLFPA